MNRKKKYPSESRIVKTEMVLPNDTNPHNTLFGGRLLQLIDVAAAISAQKHCNRSVVTASVDSVSFGESIAIGDVVTLEAKVTRAFSSSMEVNVKVWAENIPTGKKTNSNEAFLTFVAVDQAGNTIAVPEVEPQTEEETALYESALRRRQLRLLLAGRIKPEEAPELINYLNLKSE